MITHIEPTQFDSAKTIQIESDAPDQRTAIDEIEDWAASHGFVRTSEYSLRQALVEGRRRFRGICYRISDEELAANVEAQRRMEERGERLMRLSGAGRGAE